MPKISYITPNQNNELFYVYGNGLTEKNLTYWTVTPRTDRKPIDVVKAYIAGEHTTAIDFTQKKKIANQIQTALDDNCISLAFQEGEGFGHINHLQLQSDSGFSNVYTLNKPVIHSNAQGDDYVELYGRNLCHHWQLCKAATPSAFIKVDDKLVECQVGNAPGSYGQSHHPAISEYTIPIKLPTLKPGDYTLYYYVGQGDVYGVASTEVEIVSKQKVAYYALKEHEVLQGIIIDKYAELIENDLDNIVITFENTVVVDDMLIVPPNVEIIGNDATIMFVDFKNELEVYRTYETFSKLPSQIQALFKKYSKSPFYCMQLTTNNWIANITFKKHNDNIPVTVFVSNPIEPTQKDITLMNLKFDKILFDDWFSNYGEFNQYTPCDVLFQNLNIISTTIKACEFNNIECVRTYATSIKNSVITNNTFKARHSNQDEGAAGRLPIGEDSIVMNNRVEDCYRGFYNSIPSQGKINRTYFIRNSIKDGGFNQSGAEGFLFECDGTDYLLKAYQSTKQLIQFQMVDGLTFKQDSLKDWYVLVVGGTGYGAYRRIIGNSNNIIGIESEFEYPLDNTSLLKITQNPVELTLIGNRTYNQRGGIEFSGSHINTHVVDGLHYNAANALWINTWNNTQTVQAGYDLQSVHHLQLRNMEVRNGVCDIQTLVNENTPIKHRLMDNMSFINCNFVMTQFCQRLEYFSNVDHSWVCANLSTTKRIEGATGHTALSHFNLTPYSQMIDWIHPGMYFISNCGIQFYTCNYVGVTTTGYAAYIEGKHLVPIIQASQIPEELLEEEDQS